jgi:hypothetical protein
MVEISILVIAGIALAAMFFGYGFGLFEGRSQGYKKRTKEEAAEKGNKPEREPEQVMVKVDEPGLLRIKNEGGYLTLDLDGSRVDTSALNAEERKRLIEMLNLMRPWLEGRPAAAPVSQPPLSPSQTEPSPELDRLTQVGSRPEGDERIDQPPAKSAEAARPSVPVQRSRTIAREDRPIPPAGSIVSQIDSILQARLEGTPLDERGVFLAQSPEGGVMVYVGLTKYMGLEDVPDPEIKAAIRSAITEWENKYTPGL